MGKWVRDENRLWIALIAVAFLALVPLAWLQYRWISQISAADREHRQNHLRSAVGRFAWDFEDQIRRVSRISFTGQAGPPANELSGLAARYAQLAEEGVNTRIVRKLYAILGEPGHERLYEYSAQSRDFAPVEWTPELELLRPRREGSWWRPVGFTPAGAPVLVTPLISRRSHRVREGEPRPPQREAGWVIFELDTEFIARRLLPRLVERHFPKADGEFAVRIVAAETPAQVIYQTHPALPATFFSDADASVPLLEMHFPPQGERSGPPGFHGFEGRRPPDGPPAGGWRLLVKHRAGSLEQVVASTRRRNLAVSLAILLLMAATLIALLVATRRAQRLARLQLDFVAGVSHELRTPLSVVCAAADNLADGLVASKEQVRRYGTVIRADARRLSRMVEQILAFAAARSSRAKFDLQPAEIPEIVHRALADCEPEVHAAGCTVECKLEPDLPPVLADPTALTHCLRNLIDNAATHGYQGKWIGITARPGANGRNAWVDIVVEDRGQGIARPELKHIFDPFHRGGQAIQDQKRGFGLGLNLARRIAEAHSGTLDVQSELRKGTRFTLHIPAAPAELIQAEPNGIPQEET